ncbi:MAG: SphA family protein [Afipia sp.]
MRYSSRLVFGFGAMLLVAAAAENAKAAEGAVGVYLLGARGPMAGFTPPPGVYFQDDTYFYDGKISGGRTLPFGGLLVANVSASTWMNLPTTMWVTPAKVLGGDLAFSVTVPTFGEPRVNAGLLVNSPRLGPIGANVSDSQLNLSDFLVSSLIGWHSGNFHWQLSLNGVIPSGSYVAGQLSNASLNRPAVDVSGALTWLDPAIGVDLSMAMGVTFNQTNRATDYKTGDEFHLEWAASKYITKEFTIGLVGYYYQQFTGDSGSGAKLGAFEGRVIALGGTVGYTFEVGKLPISTRIKVYHEFDVQNRMEGTAGFFTVSLPLGVDSSVKPMAVAIKAKF